MIAIAKGARAGVAALLLVCLGQPACASIAGLGDYSTCEGACADGVDAGRPVATDDADTGTSPGDDDAPADTMDSQAAGDDSEASASDAPVGDGAMSGGWACTKGGCNAAGGVCAAATTCACGKDADCASGHCVPVAGLNDVACGGACTGAGAADGFGCLLASPGIPLCAVTAFGYTPSNFAASAYATHVPASPTSIGCNVTYDVAMHKFTACTGGCAGTFCAGTAAPYIASDVTQSATGGPKADVLVFAGLTVAAGGSITITSSAAGGGGNAVILAVFGDASIAGAIHADGATGASGGNINTNTPGASGPGGNHGCTVSANAGSGLNGGPACNNATSDCRDSGGGGGPGSGAGGDGGSGANGNSGNGGSAKANATLIPLGGGCPGGTSGGWACTTYGGGGGGAVQISAAGAVTVTGSITANGGQGGASTCSATQGLCSNTDYPGGGGGGGSGGAVLLEGKAVTTSGTVAVNGGAGGAAKGAGAGGAGGTSAAADGKNGGGSSGACGNANTAGGGGGGGYGYLRVNGSEPVATYACTTTLTPAPVCNAEHAACVCVDDADCATGKCLPSAQCTGACSGTGTADSVGCAVVTSHAM